MGCSLSWSEFGPGFGFAIDICVGAIVLDCSILYGGTEVLLTRDEGKLGLRGSSPTPASLLGLHRHMDTDPPPAIGLFVFFWVVLVVVVNN